MIKFSTHSFSYVGRLLTKCSNVLIGTVCFILNDMVGLYLNVDVVSGVIGEASSGRFDE